MLNIHPQIGYFRFTDEFLYPKKGEDQTKFTQLTIKYFLNFREKEQDKKTLRRSGEFLKEFQE